MHTLGTAVLWAALAAGADVDGGTVEGYDSVLTAPVGDAASPAPQPAPPPAPASDAPVAPLPPPLVAAPEPERVASQQEFVKGELSQYLGSARLVTKKNRIGVSLGIDEIGATYYARIEPQVDLRFFDRKLAVGLGVPLNFELLSLNDGSNGQPILAKNLGVFRSDDWSQPSDYARVLSYLTYGHKEDNLYINVGQVYASSIGHGAIVRRYAPDIDPNLTRVSAQVDAYNDYVGFEALTNDVIQWNLVSALAFVKPLSWASDSLFAKTLSIGATIASDLQGPLSLTRDPVTGVRLLDSHNRLLAQTGAVTLGGVDAEVKVIKTQYVDLKPYVDYSQLFNGDGGLTFGALARINIPAGSLVQALRLVGEGRYLGSRYVPSYFDTFYEVERFQASELQPRFANGIIHYLTKYETVMNGFGARCGYYVEASYGIRNHIGLTLALQGDSVQTKPDLVAHLEIPTLDFLQVFASFYKRGVSDLSTLTNMDQQSLFFAGARLRTLPFLFFNARAYKTFTMDTDVRRYQNVFGFVIDAEVGWEFWTHDQEIQERSKTMLTRASSPAFGQARE